MVVASGEELTYQWFGPGGIPLSDIPGKITGTNTSTLEISNIQSGDTGSYQVRVSNVGGSVDSNAANLVISKNLLIPKLTNCCMLGKNTRSHYPFN